jgi:hypothetical protein
MFFIIKYVNNVIVRVARFTVGCWLRLNAAILNNGNVEDFLESWKGILSFFFFFY